MSTLHLRNAAPGDFAAIVALNAAEVEHTSAMDPARLAQLHALTCHHAVIEADGDIAAFVLAMDHDAAYDNDNLRWFAAHHPRFVYVDRIVVGAAHAGHGLGAQLYRDLFARTRARRFDTIVCEYNLAPPNPASAAFHARFGFQQVGTRQDSAGRLLSMQAARVGHQNNTGIGE